MKITPLCMLAAQRIPVLNDSFADELDVASMSVEAGNLVTVVLNTPLAYEPGDVFGISVTDSYEPNQIVSWSQYSAAADPIVNGDVLIETAYPHTISASPDATRWTLWNSTVLIDGTGVLGIDGNCVLVKVPDETHLVFRPRGATGSVTIPSLPNTAVLMQRMEREVVGWHKATMVDETSFTFPTPASVTRDYDVALPKIVVDIRIWGAVDLAHALSKFSVDSEAIKSLDDVKLDQAYMFVTPKRDVRLSRDRRSLSNTTTQIMPGQFVRQELMDGFEIFVILPAERYGGAVDCQDRCAGPILAAIMRTFNGLRLPFSEFSSPNPFCSMLSGHRNAGYNLATYIHNYSFDATVYIGDEDCAPSVDVPDLIDFDAAIQNGTTPPDSVNPVGTVPISAIVFDPGIYQKGKPQPLLARVEVDIQ